MIMVCHRQNQLLDDIVASGGQVIAIGKVGDIYAHRGISKEIRADGNMALFDEFLKEVAHALIIHWSL